MLSSSEVTDEKDQKGVTRWIQTPLCDSAMWEELFSCRTVAPWRKHGDGCPIPSMCRILQWNLCIKNWWPPSPKKGKGALMELKCRHRGRRKPILGAVPHSCISVILENTLNQQKNLWSVLQPHNVNHTGSHWPASRQWEQRRGSMDAWGLVLMFWKIQRMALLNGPDFSFMFHYPVLWFSAYADVNLCSSCLNGIYISRNELPKFYDVGENQLENMPCWNETLCQCKKKKIICSS